MKYYKLIIDGNDTLGGVLYAPSSVPYPIARDGQEVKNWQSLVLELRDGVYCHFHACTGGANIISEEFTKLIESFTGDNNEIEYLPVKVISKEYGDRIYYILHFRKIFDVIDKAKTIYAKDTDVILRVRLDNNKTKNLIIFNSQPAINDVIVCEDLYKAIKRNHYDLGIEFMLMR